MEHNDLYIRLLSLIKMFKDRPNHLTKYLIDNDALNDIFIDKICNNDTLKKIGTSDHEIRFFPDIKSMEEYYSSFISNNNDISPDIIEELNNKLMSYIFEEKYEDAAEIRDYMIRLGIKKK